MISDVDVPFQRYLEAKFPIDTESLHAPTFRIFRNHLSELDHATVIDLGTGTGAMIRRLLPLVPPGRFRFIGVDADQDCLATALDRTAHELSESGYTITAYEDHLEARHRAGRETREVEVKYLHGSIFDPSIQARLADEQPSATTAHALMDCLPVECSTNLVRRTLTAGGLFYATLNYDGRTDLKPTFEDGQFESMLLNVYNLSMDERRVMGRPIAGSRSGTRLYGELLSKGFVLLSSGASDWSLTATDTRYRPSVLTVLRALLGTIYREMVVQHDGSRPEIDLDALDRWYRARIEAVRTGILTVMVHQTDILARRT